MKLTTDIFGAIRTAVLSILLCCLTVKLHRTCNIFFNTLAAFITYTQITLGCGITGARGLLVPADCLFPVLRHADPPLIAHTHAEHPPGVLLFRSLAIPMNRSGPTLLYALAIFIAPGQVALGPGQALPCGGPIPADRFLPVLLHTLANLIEIA